MPSGYHCNSSRKSLVSRPEMVPMTISGGACVVPAERIVCAFRYVVDY